MLLWSSRIFGSHIYLPKPLVNMLMLLFSLCQRNLIMDPIVTPHSVLLQQYIPFKYFCCIHLYVCLSVCLSHVYKCLQGPEEGVRGSPWAGVTSDCEPPDMIVGNGTQVLWKGGSTLTPEPQAQTYLFTKQSCSFPFLMICHSVFVNFVLLELDFIT